MQYLVTGAAGFIGFHLAQALLTRGDHVVGLDNMNHYYSPKLKEDRIAKLTKHKAFSFYTMDLCDFKNLQNLFSRQSLNKVCHLAAQAGVRYSLENPFVYQRSNIEGFLNILELCRRFKIENLVFASSSSVYGANEKIPFCVTDNTDRPISLYATTKKANELMAYAYHHLYGLKCTGLRFFTVYGPWGRPDMALFKFTRGILEGRTIDVYNKGNMKRDFTYIDDIVSGIVSALDKDFEWDIFNLGNSNSVSILYFIECIEKELGITAFKNYLSMQAGDVPRTYAEIEHSRDKLGFSPGVSIEEGIHRFIVWYKDYYKIGLPDLMGTGID